MSNTTAGKIETGQTGRIAGLGQISVNYDLVLCDVWGVLHNGLKAWPDAVDALSRFRKSGGRVVMVTNAPRPRGPVLRQLEKLGVPPETFDIVVTSGDVTRELMRQMPRKMFFIGMWEKDKNLFEGMDIELVEEAEAEAVICTGLFNDDTEKPQDYEPLLKRLQKRDLPFVCANPDIVVEVGDRLLYCAGALAREYARLGGRTLIAGKPHAPIYEAAIAEAEELSGKKFPKSSILAIGDGMPTDIKGARDFGLDVLYISAGIHAAEYGLADDPDHARVNSFLADQGANPVAYMPRLKW